MVALADTPDAPLAALDRAGYRLTGPRRTVARLIGRRTGHFTAADLVDDAAIERLDIGRATIFRTIDVFEAVGAIERIDLPSGTTPGSPASPRPTITTWSALGADGPRRSEMRAWDRRQPHRGRKRLPDRPPPTGALRPVSRVPGGRSRTAFRLSPTRNEPGSSNPAPAEAEGPMWSSPPRVPLAGPIRAQPTLGSTMIRRFGSSPIDWVATSG